MAFLLVKRVAMKSGQGVEIKMKSKEIKAALIKLINDKNLKFTSATFDYQPVILNDEFGVPKAKAKYGSISFTIS